MLCIWDWRGSNRRGRHDCVNKRQAPEKDPLSVLSLSETDGKQLVFNARPSPHTGAHPDTRSIRTSCCNDSGGGAGASGSRASGWCGPAPPAPAPPPARRRRNHGILSLLVERRGASLQSNWSGWKGV